MTSLLGRSGDPRSSLPAAAEPLAEGLLVEACDAVSDRAAPAIGSFKACARELAAVRCLPPRKRVPLIGPSVCAGGVP